jgi:hypothetical protein
VRQAIELELFGDRVLEEWGVRGESEAREARIGP